MKGPTYILKKTHLEHDEKREYKQHIMKLQNIKSQKLKGELIRSVSVDKKFVEDKEKKKIQNRLFKEDEQKRLQKLENKALISKLEEIQKGKFSIMRGIKDQTFKESVQYLSSNQGMKSGINFNPSTSRTRLRTYTANTESSRNINNLTNYNRNSDQIDDPNTIPLSQQDNKNAKFFNHNQNFPHKMNRSQSNVGDQSQRGYINPKNMSSNPNLNQFDGAGNHYLGMNNQSHSTNQNPNSTNGINNNNNNKENQPQTLMGDNQNRALKTEGNNYNDEEETHKIYNNADSNNNPNFYKNYNNNQSTGQFNPIDLMGDDRFRQRNQVSQDRNISLSRDGKRRRINSSINLASLNKHVSASIERQKEQERIAFENNKIVQRMLKLPPVIPTKSNLKKDVQKQKKLLKQISKFHDFKERKVPSFAKSKNGMNLNNMLGLLDGVPLDENNQELMDQRVHLVINVKEIAFVNFLPISTETEKYFMEIQASIHEIRRTNPEVYSDFSKAVINEFFYLRELKQSRIMYIGLYKWTPLDNGEHFLGDFELDLTPYYLQSGVHQIHYDLRNYKQTQKLPNYMVKDMRKKGWIDIEISIKSSIKQYLMDLDIIKRDYGSQEASIAYDNSNYVNPAQKKKSSEESLVHLINQTQSHQTEKQQKLQQLKYQIHPTKKSYNSQNISTNQGNKQIAGIQQNSYNNQSNNSFNTLNHTYQNSGNSKKDSVHIGKVNQNSKLNTQQQDDYDQENFEKDISSLHKTNNSYDQQFTDQEDGNYHNSNNKNSGKNYIQNNDEEIEL